MTRQKWIYGISWTVLIILALSYLFFGITHEGFWTDEAFTGLIARLPATNIVAAAAQDYHPPLYFLLVRTITFLFGNTVLVIRSVSVLGILALMLLGIGPVRRLADDKTGFLFALLVLLLPASLQLGQNARMYTWAAFFVSAAVFYSKLLGASSRIRDWLFYGLSSLAAAYTHYYALLAAVLCFIITFIRMMIDKAGAKPVMNMALIGAGFCLLYAPWVLVLLKQGQSASQAYWIPGADFQMIANTLIFPFNVRSGWFPHAFQAVLAFFFVLGLAVFAIIQGFRNKSERRTFGSALLTCVLVYALTLISVLAISIVIKPILWDRYMFVCVGLLLLPAAVGIASFKKPLTRVILVAIYVALVAVQNFRTSTLRYNGPIAEAMRYIAQSSSRSERFLHYGADSFYTFSYYFPDSANFLVGPEGANYFSNYRVAEPNGKFTEKLAKVFEGGGEAWLVETMHQEAPPVNDAIARGELIALGASRVFILPSSYYNIRLTSVALGR